MDNTAYTENLRRIAEKFAKHCIDNIDTRIRTKDMLPLAAIALEEMAEAYGQGFTDGHNKSYPKIEILGLTPTKTDSNG